MSDRRAFLWILFWTCVVTAAVYAFVAITRYGMAQRKASAPICRWLHHGPSYECWYYCGANWHPTADDLRRFGGTPPQTTKDASGRVLHWRSAP